MKKLLIFLVVFFILFAFPTAKKASGVRGEITYQGGIEWNPISQITWLGNSTNPAMCENNGNYDVVWQDDRNGNWEIYYSKLTYFGFKLVNDSKITNFNGNDTNPVVVSNGNHVFVVWQREIGNKWAIYFARLLYSNRNITIDVPPKELRGVNNATNPKIAMDSQGFIHVVWQEYRNGQWDIMYDKIDENGNPVFSPIDISNDVTNSTDPVIVTTPNNNVDVLWLDDNVTPGYGVMYRGLDCCGYFRTSVRRISVVSPSTEISASYEDGINVAFSDNRENRSSEIIFTKLNDTGVTVVDDKNLTALDGINSDEPMISSSRGRNFLVWRDMNKEIKFAIFDSSGNRIVENINISGENSSEPRIAINFNMVNILWEEKIGGKYHLFMRSGRFPNLKVEKLHVEQMGTERKIIVNATVSSDTREKISVEYGIYVDGEAVRSGNISLEEEKSLSFIFPISGGLHNITFAVDPNNRIFESNESDNVLSENIFVRSYAYQLALKKDYYLTPGNETNISVSIINTGNWKDNYTLEFENLSSGIFISPSRRMLSLNSSKEKILNFTLFVGKEVKIGNYTITLNVSSHSNITSVENLTVHVIPRMYFEIQYDNLHYVLPGADYNIKIKIINLGDCNDSYFISLLTNSTWPTILENETMNISAGNAEEAIIHVAIPNGTDAFTKTVFLVGVESSKSHMVENATIMVIVAPYHHAEAYVIHANFTGGNYYFQIMVINTGNLVDFFNFNVSGEMESYSLLSEYSSLLPKGGKCMVNLSVFIPPEFLAGSYSLSFNVFSGNISLLSLPLSLTVPSKYSFSASATAKGDEIILTIKNEGNAPDSITIMPTMKKNMTWEIEYLGRNYTNISYVLLQPNQTAKVTITPKGKLENGEYNVNLILKSSSGLQKNISVKIKIGEEGGGILGFIMDNLLYIVIAVVAVVAIFIYLTMRK